MDNKKSAKSSEMKKPHFYGKRDGVHLFHATMPEHRDLVGKHVENPSDDDMHLAIQEAKKSGVACVVIHGTPPESLRSKIHEHLGTLSPSQMHKSERANYRPIRSTEYELIDEDDHHPLKKDESVAREHAPQASVKVNPFFNPALLERKSISTGHKEAVEPGAHRVTPLALRQHLKSGSFSLLTAQNPMGQAADAKYNEQANERLESDLKSHGAIYHKVRGKYGSNEEHSYMVHHTAGVTPEKLEEFARQHGQESIIHSSQGRHRMVHVNGEHAGKHFMGEGHTHVPDADDYFSEIDSSPAKKFSLNFNFEQMHHDPHNPFEENRKSEKIYFQDLQKAFLQPDQKTFTDIKAHAAAIPATHPKLMEWGTAKLSSLPKDAIETLELDGKTIKVRKHDTDMYSGWVEKDGNKLHAFDHVTLPELLLQLQSKLELYGKEDKVVAPDLKDMLAKLRSMVEDHFKEDGQEFPHEEFEISQEGTKSKLQALKDKVDSKLNPDPFDETREDEIKEKEDFDQADAEARQKMMFDEMNELEDQIKEIHEEVVPKKELVGGMIAPEQQCEDCGSKAPICDCYTGLPRPRLEFDGQKVTIFFKSEWAQEDRENFVEDLKRRAGQILKSRHVSKL